MTNRFGYVLTKIWDAGDDVLVRLWLRRKTVAHRGRREQPSSYSGGHLAPTPLLNPVQELQSRLTPHVVRLHDLTDVPAWELMGAPLTRLCSPCRSESRSDDLDLLLAWDLGHSDTCCRGCFGRATLDQWDPASPELSASSGCGTLLCNAMRPSFTSHCVCCGGGARTIDSWTEKSHPKSLRVHASSWHSASRFQEAGLTPAAMPALFQLFALGPEGPGSPDDTTETASVVALCSSIPGGRSSQRALRLPHQRHWVCSLLRGRGPGFTRRHCDLGFCRGAVLRKLGRPSFTNSFLQLSHRQGELCRLPPGQENPASPEDPSNLCEVLDQ